MKNEFLKEVRNIKPSDFTQHLCAKLFLAWHERMPMDIVSKYIALTWWHIHVETQHEIDAFYHRTQQHSLLWQLKRYQCHLWSSFLQSISKICSNILWNIIWCQKLEPEFFYSTSFAKSEETSKENQKFKGLCTESQTHIATMSQEMVLKAGKIIK